jgi:DNA-binding MarR family transcriptional regulator
MNNRKDSIAQGFIQLLPLVYNTLNKDQSPSKQTDLTHLQSHILETLFHSTEGISISQLAKNIDISKQQMTPLIHKLEESDYIKKVRDLNDKRSFNLILTDKGKEVITSKWADLYHVFCHKLDQINEEDQVDLEFAIHKINRILGKLNHTKAEANHE